jgi:hypothetical protein
MFLALQDVYVTSKSKDEERRCADGNQKLHEELVGLSLLMILFKK